MKIVTTIARTLLGILFVFGSLAYFFKWFPQPELTGDMKTFNDGLNASGYLVPLIKATELICGISFIVGRFVPLALVVIFPIVINIISVHVFIAPEGIPIALFVLLTSLFLVFRNREHYKALLVS